MTEMIPEQRVSFFDLLWVVRFELAYYLEPRDVLNLACTCKKLCSYLCNEPAIRKRALQCARLALQCVTCGTETNNKVIEELAIRLCNLCEKTELIPAPIQPSEFLNTTIWQNGPHRWVKVVFRRDPVGARYITRLKPITSSTDPATCPAQVITAPVYSSYDATAWPPTWPKMEIAPMWPQQIMAGQHTQMDGVTYYGATISSEGQVPRATSRRTSSLRQSRSRARARDAPYHVNDAHH